jgi:predicted nucleic acid-binding protein
MYLLDTNIFLEFLLNQEKADDVQRLLLEVPPEHLHLSEFTLDSIGVILFRRDMHAVFLKAIDDLILVGGLQLMRLCPDDLQKLIQAAREFGLDYDDAYQYALAEKYNLILVSLDSDFDRTKRGRAVSAEILQKR